MSRSRVSTPSDSHNETKSEERSRAVHEELGSAEEGEDDDLDRDLRKRVAQ